MNLSFDQRQQDVAQPGTPVISARNLRKAYKNKLALADTTFGVRSGRIVGLIGPNGAGKTTALKAILGLIPFEGDLNVLGRDPRTQRDRHATQATDART
jgi:ABC-2 type transport system ATP-binding protein